MRKDSIQPITMKHIQRYGDIYAKAFSGEPWNKAKSAEDVLLRLSAIFGDQMIPGNWQLTVIRFIITIARSSVKSTL